MTGIVKFKDELQEALDAGAVYKLTSSYVKVRRWSMRAYFTTLSNWRIKRIGHVVGVRLKRIAEREERRETAKATKRTRRTTAFETAASSIGLKSS